MKKSCGIFRLGSSSASAAICLLGTTALALGVSLPSVNCVAQGDDGGIVFQGHASSSSSSNQQHVCEWLGIPYAQPPVGDLRFAAPIELDASTSTNTSLFLSADRYGYDCPQTQASYFAYPSATAQYARIYANFVNQLNNTQSEDCLTLNIWSRTSKTEVANSTTTKTEGDITTTTTATKTTTPTQDAPSLKPVLVFIYGGRFSAGTSNTPFYRGEYLARAQDVVVVTFNFRMNIFGFPGSPEITGSQGITSRNLALLDQRMAVTWVRDHVVAFGGDPERITIVGQSSGSWAVGNWVYAFEEDPIVAGAISHSGNVFSFDSNSADLAASNWYNVTEYLGCGGATTMMNTLDCMRSPNITFQAILQAAARVPTTGSLTRSLPAFQITQDNITVFSTTEYANRLAAGDLAHIPYLETHNDHESGFYRISARAKGVDLPESNWTQFEQETFTCPVGYEAAGRAKLNITSYRMRYMADWENLRLFYQADPPYDSGAYHGADINMIIGNSEEVSSGILPEGEEVMLTGVMQKAWAAFARDPADGLTEEMGWPKYKDDEETLILLGQNTTSEVKFVNPEVYDYVCPELDLGF